MTYTRREIERWRANFDYSGNVNDCMIWKGYGRGGYGRMRVRGPMRSAHVISYELFHQDVPAGMVVCHACDTPSCVNPKHLFIGTRAINNYDRDRKKRQVTPRGESNGSAVLNADKVRQIRQMRAANVPYKVIARKFEIAEGTISFIIKGVTWRHVL